MALPRFQPMASTNGYVNLTLRNAMVPQTILAKQLRPYIATTFYRSPRQDSAQPSSALLVQTPDVGLGNGKTARPPLYLTWPHPGWSEKVVHEIITSHRKPETFGDRFAWRVIRVCRWAMDLVTGLGPEQQVDTNHPSTATAATRPLTESQWLVRFIFLESVAGVPGMVAGTLRHLHSIRRLKHDQGWIKTLLEESYNERMHLLTFLEMYKPGWLMRSMIFVAQGIFYNTMFVSYLVSPKVSHRFVGYLEEEAVHTYTRCLREMDEGHLPAWTDTNFKIPDIAIRYWNLKNGQATMKDLILYIRADEASHRGVNHTLGNLDQVKDRNPFSDNGSQKETAALRPTGLEREELM
ncbi:alternative oxidase-domain-containing protein [Diplogelasinospora grovesii]|uniref:Alternative oxidase n=1 Tax=Diplogelasinospora grovesii TaxID=303347 RepID=A0AAN6MUZ4_9PEZI|nr:alternative oxidase-domain-containing protein [Diplogelasinospora grovesii]